MADGFGRLFDRQVNPLHGNRQRVAHASDVIQELTPRLVIKSGKLAQGVLNLLAVPKRARAAQMRKRSARPRPFNKRL